MSTAATIRVLLLLAKNFTTHTTVFNTVFTMNTDHEEAEEEEEGHFFFAFYLHTSTFFRKLGWFTHCGKRLTFVQNILILV